MKVANSLPKEASKAAEDTLPATTKTDKKSHGYGLRSISEIVSRYGGSMEIRTEDDQFQLFLYMPMEDADE